MDETLDYAPPPPTPPRFPQTAAAAKAARQAGGVLTLLTVAVISGVIALGPGGRKAPLVVLAVVVAPGVGYWVLSEFVRRRRLWAARAVAAAAVVHLAVCLMLCGPMWPSGPGTDPAPAALLGGLAVALFGPTAWSAWQAAGEIRKHPADGQRGFEPVVPPPADPLEGENPLDLPFEADDDDDGQAPPPPPVERAGAD